MVMVAATLPGRATGGEEIHTLCFGDTGPVQLLETGCGNDRNLIPGCDRLRRNAGLVAPLLVGRDSLVLQTEQIQGPGIKRKRIIPELSQSPGMHVFGQLCAKRAQILIHYYSG